MPTTHLDKSKSIIKGMSAVRKGAETIIKYFLGHQVGRMKCWMMSRKK